MGGDEAERTRSREAGDDADRSGDPAPETPTGTGGDADVPIDPGDSDVGRQSSPGASGNRQSGAVPGDGESGDDRARRLAAGLLWGVAGVTVVYGLVTGQFLLAILFGAVVSIVLSLVRSGGGGARPRLGGSTAERALVAVLAGIPLVYGVIANRFLLGGVVSALVVAAFLVREAA